MVVSYALALPGALGWHAIYDNGQGYIFRTGPYSMIMTLHNSRKAEHHMLAWCVATWAFLLPVVKLLAYIAFRCMRNPSERILITAQQICKWCMVDAMIPLGCVGLLVSDPHFSLSHQQGKHIECLSGLYYFLLQQVLCSMAFLTLVNTVKPDKPKTSSEALEADVEQTSTSTISGRTTALLCILAMAGLLYGTFCLQLMVVVINPLYGSQITVTIYNMISNMFLIGDILPGQIMFFILIVAPMADIMIEILQLGGYKINRTVALWAQHFCMIDVSFLAMCGEKIFLNCVFPQVTVTIPLECKAYGFFLYCLVAVWNVAEEYTSPQDTELVLGLIPRSGYTLAVCSWTS